MNRVRLTHEILAVTVQSEDAAGWGVAEHEGRTLRIKGALTGERVTVRMVRFQGKQIECRVDSVLDASSERQAPPCEHFAVCGGCTHQHMTASTQVHRKQTTLLRALAAVHVVPAKIEKPLITEPLHYRRKARLSARFTQKNQRVFLGFREAMSHQIADIEACVVLAPPFADLIAPLRRLLVGLSVRHAIPQLEIAVGETANAVVVRHVLPLTQQDRRLLASFAQEHAVNVYLQPAGPDSIVALEGTLAPLTYTLAVAGRTLTFEFQPLDFVQVNAAMNRLIVQRVLGWLDPRPGERVLDLFCGLGNLTLPLAVMAREVVGVEQEATLLERAAANARSNGVENARFVAMDLHAAGASRLLRLAPFDAVVLDPPRSGAGAVLGVIGSLGANRLVYVSCNTVSFAADAKILIEQGFRLDRVGVADMFPQTAHVETVALFCREGESA